VTHGTLTAYTKGCRCDQCRVNWRDYHRAKRGSRIVEREPSGAASDPDFWERVREVQGLRYGRRL
jgi:hypothetical protein